MPINFYLFLFLLNSPKVVDSSREILSLSSRWREWRNAADSKIVEPQKILIGHIHLQAGRNDPTEVYKYRLGRR